jgi:hypothetical protein
MAEGAGKAVSAAAAVRLLCVPGRPGYARVRAGLDARAGTGDPQEVSHDRSRYAPARRNQGW